MCVCVRLRDLVFIPPIIKLGGGILESGCPSVRSANKLGMIVHHHDLLCHANRLGFFKVKVTVGAQIIKKITVSSISPELLNLLQPNLVLCCIMTSRRVVTSLDCSP